MAKGGICSLCLFVWIVTCIGMTTYLVFWQGHSGWWFALAVFLAMSLECEDPE